MTWLHIARFGIATARNDEREGESSQDLFCRFIERGEESLRDKNSRILRANKGDLMSKS